MFDVDAPCEPDVDICTFMQNYDVTPIGSSVLPRFHFGNTFVNITGSGFGSDSSTVEVDVDGYLCDIVFLNDTAIDCFLESTPVGRTQPVQILVGDLGTTTCTTSIRCMFFLMKFYSC